MIGAARRYRELLLDLVLERALHGGSLPPDVESPRIAELDRCWREMSEEEQDEAERTCALGSLAGAHDLAVEDQDVTEGSPALPRRARRAA